MDKTETSPRQRAETAPPRRRPVVRALSTVGAVVWLPLLCAVSTVADDASAIGPLRVHPDHPCWLARPDGRAVWLTNPTANTGQKVIVVDTDHCDPWHHDPDWVWKNLFRGNQFILMDGYTDFRLGSPRTPDPKWDRTRTAMGRARALAERLNLTDLAPNSNLASTGYCLASVSGEGEFTCAVYLPQGDEAAVDLSGVKGKLAVHWIEVGSGEGRSAAPATGGSRKRFVAPFSAPAILWLTGKQDVGLP